MPEPCVVKRLAGCGGDEAALLAREVDGFAVGALGGDGGETGAGEADGVLGGGGGVDVFGGGVEEGDHRDVDAGFEGAGWGGGVAVHGCV